MLHVACCRSKTKTNRQQAACGLGENERAAPNRPLSSVQHANRIGSECACKRDSSWVLGLSEPTATANAHANGNGNGECE